VPWGRPVRSSTEARLEGGVLSGIGVLRWASVAWMAVVLVVGRDDVVEPVGAWVAFTVVVTWTAFLWHLVRVRSPWVLWWPTAAAELAIGFGLLAADRWVYDGPHPQTLGSPWPVAGAMALGVIVGPAGGLVAGIVLGLGRLSGTLLDHDMAQPTGLSLASTGVLYGLTGAVAGLAMQRLRAAEVEISAARAREEVARTLHDGVLQTLAVVQRRSSDPDLAALAREQEWELRQFLAGTPAGPGDLLGELRAAAGRHQRHHPGRVEVIVTEDPPVLPGPLVDAVVGASREAMNNAVKHGNATRIVVYVDPGDDEVFVSVKDDGTGFEASAVTHGTGIQGSILARMAEVGGRVEIDGNPGHGSEVRLWVPYRLPAR
jgi:signal transduction histidine kinase